MKSRNAECFFLTIGLVIGSLLVSTVYADPKFMSFPFNDPEVKLQQGWLYDFPFTLCGTSDPNYPYCHYAIDYIKGVVDQSSTSMSKSAARCCPLFGTQE